MGVDAVCARKEELEEEKGAGKYMHKHIYREREENGLGETRRFQDVQNVRPRTLFLICTTYFFTVHRLKINFFLFFAQCSAREVLN